MSNTMEIKVAKNSWHGWRDYARRVDYVPDSMTLRTAELFFNGATGCKDLGEKDLIWEAIDRNLHGLLTFVDTVLTREAVPLIAYSNSYKAGAAESIGQLIGQLAIPVTIENPVYDEVSRAAVAKLKTLNIGAIPEVDVLDVIGELRAFAYDWNPNLFDYEESDPNRRLIAQFIVGGLMFGWYAQVSETDHLIQAKRSRVFAALTKPDHKEGDVKWEQEVKIFEALRETCLGADTVRLDEMPAGPTIMPYLLFGAEGKSPATTKEVLDHLLSLRESGLGASYREWFKDLRTSLLQGRYATDAKDDIEVVRVELEHRLRGKFPKWSREFKLTLPTLSIDVPGAKLSMGKLELVGNVRLGVPDWIRNWLLDLSPFGRHRKLLLRTALAEAEYRNVSKHLWEMWSKS